MVSRRTADFHSEYLDSLYTLPGGFVSAMLGGRQGPVGVILLCYLLAVEAVSKV